jgi:hypothetical protein
MNPGTIYLYTRRSKSDPWSILNCAEFSTEMGYLNAMEHLENFRAGYIHDPRFTNHQFQVSTTEPKP